MFENVRKVLSELSDTLETLYKRKLIEANLVASKNLVNSIAVNYRQQGTWFEVVIRLEDYWKNIEYGRRPNSHFPPVDQITQWIRIKPIIPQEDTLGRVPSESQLAFLIGRKIARDGIEPKPLLAESVEEVLNEFETQLTEALQADVEGFTETYLMELIGKTKFRHLTVKI